MPSSISSSKNIVYQSAVYAEGNIHIGDIYNIAGGSKEIPFELTTLPYIAAHEVIGRDEDLEAISTLVMESERVVLVNGLGGIGKTTIAKYFLKQYRPQFQYIAWVQVLSTIQESFVNNPELIDSLGLRLELDSLPHDENWIETGFKIVLNRMRNLGNPNGSAKNLLIIDNASDDIEPIQILDRIALRPKWKVLVTSREQMEGFSTYELGLLNPENALQLFYQHYHHEQADELVKKILQTIDYHTLLIEVISKSAQALRLNLSDILDQLKKKGLHISSEIPLKFPHADNQKIRDVFAYLATMFQTAQMGEQEQWVLMQFSVIPSVYLRYRDSSSENLLFFLQIQEHNRDFFTQALNSLTSKGWLQWDTKNDAFKMHHLVQEIVLQQLKPTVQHCNGMIDSFTILLRVKGIENPVLKMRFADYAEKIVERIIGESIPFSLLCYHLGEIHRHLVGFDTAIDYHTKAQRIQERQNHPDNHTLGSIYAALGLCYTGKRDAATALDFQLKELAIFEKIAAPVDLAIAYDNVGLAYQSLNDAKQALSYHLKAFDIFEKNLNESDFSLSQSYHNVSLAYANLGQFEQALFFGEKALFIRKKLMDEKHPAIAQSLHNLSFVYFKLRQYTQAWDAISEAYTIRKEVLGDKHPYFLNSEKRMGEIRRAIGM
jgi:tetratricopeptide (TPR) repeat protein